MRETPARATLRDLGVLREHDGHVWLELSTSGTAGTSRTVRRSLESWEGSFEHVSRLTGITAGDTVLVPAPPSSSMFAFARVHSAHVGAAVVTLPRWSVRDAEAALARCTVAHLTPTMLTSLLDRDLGQLRTVVCAGAALPAAVRQRATDAGLVVVDYYGAAELSFVAMRANSRLAPFPEVEVDVRDEVIWARSPWLAEGYAPGESGPMRRDPDGWATVGDRGHLDDALGLVVLGRGDDTVTTGGATVLCADVEGAVLASPDVSAAVVLGTPHAQLGELLEVVVTSMPGVEVDLDALRARTAGLVSRTHLPRRWHAWTELPLTAAGKVDRTEVLRQLLAARSSEASA